MTQDDPITLKQLRTALIAILVSSAGVFASDMYLPSLPFISQEFGVGDNLIQLTLTSYFIGLSLSPLVYGPLSDRIGRRKVLLIGCAISLLGCLLCAFAPSAHFLIATRLLQGVGAGAAACLFRAIMRDIFTGIRLSQVGSLAGMVFWLAPALAPILGGFIEAHFNWRMNFEFLSIYLSLLGFIIWYGMPETNKNLSTQATQLKTILSNYTRLLKCRQFTTYVICSSMSFAGLIAYATLSPFIFEENMHLSPQHYGWLAIYITLSAILGRTINSIIVRRAGIRRLSLVGIVIMLIAGILILDIAVMGTTSIMSIMLPVSLYVIGSSFVFTNAMAGAFSPFPDIAGSASALFGCIQISTPFIISGILAALHATSVLALAIVYVSLASIALSVFYVGIWRRA